MATTNNGATAITPDVGIVTWESEGQEGGVYHSRVLHVPSDASGLTIGRGYDMKDRSAADIVQDLTDSDVLLVDATTLSTASGLQGDAAREFIKTNKLEKYEISKAGQKSLFLKTYAVIKSDVKRICTKADVVEKYGKCEWNKLNPAIVDILVDLRFRGDYTSGSRTLLQKDVVNNDLDAFAKVIKAPANWVNVPTDRRARRSKFVDQALAAKKFAEKLVKPATPVSATKK